MHFKIIHCKTQKKFQQETKEIIETTTKKSKMITKGHRNQVLKWKLESLEIKAFNAAQIHLGSHYILNKNCVRNTRYVRFFYYQVLN